MLNAKSQAGSGGITPGPLCVELESDGEFIIAPEAGDPFSTPAIARVFKPHLDYAMLFRAAPELLTALRMLLPALTNVNGNDPVRKLALDAIAKAEGRQP